MNRRELNQWMLLARMPCVGWAGLLVPLHTAAQAAADNPLDRITERLRAEYLATLSPGNAAEVMSAQSQDGSWPDIDYADRSSGRWLPVRHVERVRSLAVAYAQPGHALFKAPAARMAVVAAVRAWLARKPVSSNWWQNTIGLQLTLMPVLVLMDDELPPHLRTEALASLHDPAMVPPGQATGQNLIWYAMQQVVRGVLRRDETDVALASLKLQGELSITVREGIQPDYSFHQHGPQLYTGGYGLGLLMDSVRMAGLLADTPWAYPRGRLETLSTYTLDGVRPLIRGPWLDWSARGREFTRLPGNVSRPRALLPTLQALAALAPARRGELAALVSYVDSGAKGAPVTGNRHYWRSDFMVHQSATGYVSVRMVSTRTVGTEAGNGENLQGYWLPFGVTYLLRRGDEYDGLPPVWDWSRLPGLTAPDEVPPFSGLQRHASRFVGAVSDGRSGAAALVLNKLDTTARKAWFLHGELMVALGADIQSTRDAPVATTLNQTRWTTEVVTDRGKVEPARGSVPVGQAQWVWHDGITYVLHDAKNATLALEDRSGGGIAINAQLGAGKVRARVLTLAIDHGTRPRGATYAYAVWTGASAAADAARSPAFTVIENSSRQQSVRHEAEKIVQAVMHEAGAVALDETHGLRVNLPCVVQAVPQGKGWDVSIADPTAQARGVEVSLLEDGRSGAVVRVPLSAGAAQGGRSVALRLDKPS